MIFDSISDIDPKSAQAMLADFQQIMQRASYPKNHLLHKEDTVCNDLYFIEQGLARAFYFKDGQDITAHIAVENTSITAIDSFIQRKRSRYNIELLEDSVVIYMPHKELHELLAQKPQYEKLIRIYLQEIYIDLAERVEDLLFHTAKERYDKLLSKNPGLLQRINLKHIASYVGITQETLSRIRGKDWVFEFDICQVDWF